MKIVELKPEEIKVRQERQRFRNELGDVAGLADSISRIGQILPVRITQENVLIDGGRRVAACLMNQQKVICVYDETISEDDELLLRTMELEGNLYRKDYTAAEEARAVRELHKLKQKIDPTHTVRDTAKILGRKSHASVISDIQVADLVDAFPALEKAKNKREIQRAAKTLERTVATLESMKKHEKEVEKTGTNCKLKLCDALVEMANVPDNSIDIVITDPLYEIDYKNLKYRVWDRYKDRFDDSYKGLEAYEVLARESFRFTTNNAHLYSFVGNEHFYKVRDIFVSNNWLCYIKPIIWIKGTTGQCNVPSVWPASCYEMILYARKQDSQIVKQAEPDWIHVKPLHAEQKTHEFEKPVELIEDLLDRSALPGQKLIDPFMGSGAIIEAALKRGLYCVGFDVDQVSYATALKRASKY